MRLAFAIVGALMLGTSAYAQSGPPRYDVESYCGKVAAAVGGSSQIMNTCMRQEQTAYNDLKSRWTSVPSQAATYCNKVSGAVGGTYQILKTCIEQETQASSSKPKFQY